MTPDIQQRAAEAVRDLGELDLDVPGSFIQTTVENAAALITELAGQLRWRPISEAPKDGTQVLLGGIKNGSPIQTGQWGMVGRVAFNTKNQTYGWKDGPNEIDRPTHFMPLPPPPEEKK